MSWLVDNATTFYILFGLIAAAMVLIWRSNGQNKYLGYAVAAIGAIVLVVAVAFFIPTDRKQLEANVQAMAHAVEKGNVDDLFKHISKDFAYKGLTRELLYEAARRSIKTNQIGRINISQFNVEEVSHANKTAKVKFKVTAWDTKAEAPHPFVTQAEFVLEGEQWKLKTMRFFKTFVNTDEEIGVPGL